jgi:hypothetical protein
MMLEKYRKMVQKISSETARRVAAMLPRITCKKRGIDALFRTLNESGYDQADLVLCLLRINTPESLHDAERLVGKQITHCPPALRWKPLSLQSDRTLDDRRVLSVRPNPVLTASGRRGWLQHYHLFREGLTVTQLRQRGVTRRDLRLVMRRQWVVFETV